MKIVKHFQFGHKPLKPSEEMHICCTWPIQFQKYSLSVLNWSPDESFSFAYFLFSVKNWKESLMSCQALKAHVLCPGGNDPRYCKIGFTYCDITYTNAHTQKHTQMLHWTVLKNGWYKILFHDSKWSPTSPPQTKLMPYVEACRHTRWTGPVVFQTCFCLL